MNTNIINYQERSRTRYTEQFKRSGNFDKLVNVMSNSWMDVQEALLSILTISDIDSASGYNLDVIGEIVGQPREITSVSASGYFGFEEDPTSKSFGSVDNKNGGIYFSLGDKEGGNIVLPDSFYRSFIKAKIIGNNTGGTPEDIIKTAKLLFSPDNPVELIEDGSASFSLYIGREWDDPDQTVFPGLSEIDIAERLLPRPAGVKINYINESVLVASSIIDDWNRASNKLSITSDSMMYNNLEGV